MAQQVEEGLTPTQDVLDELDRFAALWEADARTAGSFECQRENQRRKLRTPCVIWYFEDRGNNVRRKHAQTRNLSERGISLIAKCVVLMGVPIEIRIALQGRPPVHLAGVVTFCRPAGRGYHELGVELMAHQDSPVFAEDPARAVRTLPWLHTAMIRTSRGRKPAKRRNSPAGRA